MQAISSHADNRTKKHVSAKDRIAQRVFRSSANDSLPLTIRHERLYILPTARGIAFLCVLAIMLLASINYGLNLGYALCFILIGLFSSCLLATYKNLVQIQFIQGHAADTFAGKSLVYSITLSDAARRSRSSVSISCEDATDTIDLHANSTADATFLIKNTTRGIHSLGRLTISSDFPLGLWRGWGYLHAPLQASVYPTPENPIIEQSVQHSESEGTAKKQRSEIEYTGLKTYENSDPPSRVAWKRVASGRGWYSKQFETETEQEELSIKWSDTPANLSTEQRLSRLSSWVVQAMDQNNHFVFELPGYQLPPAADSIDPQEKGQSALRALAAFNYRKETIRQQ